MVAYLGQLLAELVDHVLLLSLQLVLEVYLLLTQLQFSLLQYHCYQQGKNENECNHAKAPR